VFVEVTEPLVQAVVIAAARGLASTDPGVRSRAVWSLLNPGILDYAWNSARTRTIARVNDIPLTDEISGQLAAAASILDRLPELCSDPDIRVRVAADEVSLLLHDWDDIETGRVERPVFEGVPIRSLAVYKAYCDTRSHWVGPLVRSAKRLGAALFVRLQFASRRRA